MSRAEKEEEVIAFYLLYLAILGKNQPRVDLLKSGTNILTMLLLDFI